MNGGIKFWLEIFRYGALCAFLMLCGLQIMWFAAGIHYLESGDLPMAMGLLLGNCLIFQLASLMGILMFGMDHSGKAPVMKRGGKFLAGFSILVFLSVGFFCLGILLRGSTGNGLIGLFAFLGTVDGFFCAFLWTEFFRRRSGDIPNKTDK